MDSHNVWPSQFGHGLVGDLVDKSLTMHRAGQQILVTVFASIRNRAAMVSLPLMSNAKTLLHSTCETTQPLSKSCTSLIYYYRFIIQGGSNRIKGGRYIFGGKIEGF